MTSPRLAALLFAAAVASATLPALAQSLSPRDAALRVMGAGINAPGSAAYCRSKGWLQDVDLEPVAGWNRKHDALMRKAVKVLEATGGMSQSDRQVLDRVALQMVKAQIEDGDPRANCRALIDGIRADALDMGRVPELKEAIEILNRQ